MNSTLGSNILIFDADSVPEEIYVSSSRPLFESAQLISASISLGYKGLPVYCGFQMEGRSLLAASARKGAGLKIRWNKGNGLPGESCSGLFLFKTADFTDVGIDALPSIKSQTVAEFEFGYLNPGVIGPHEPVAVASLRIVFKDGDRFYISASIPISSTGEARVSLGSQTYFAYDPSTNTSQEVGICGTEVVPKFQNVENIGFRLDAVRGAKVSEGANIGVVRFSLK
ncbi:MAG: hypothetical protein ACON5O_07465 [Lentimonas sp.]